MARNPFASITVIPNYFEGHTIQWQLDLAFNSSSPCNFFVESSGTIDFSELITEVNVGDTFFYRDQTNIKQNIQTNYFYRVRLEIGNEVFYSQSSAVFKPGYTRRQYIIASEIVRKEAMRASKFTGGSYYLLKLKSYGSDDVDPTISPVTGLALTSGAPDYGSSKTGGYYAPVPMVLSVEDSIVNIRKLNPDGSGVVETSEFTARTQATPIIDTNDVIVDTSADQRWLVKDRQNTPFPGGSLNIIQILKLSLIPPTDALYSINVKD